MKEKILNALLKLVQAEHAQAQSALSSTKELAQSDDMKSESKYDTRGIEAGYLAGAQEKRVKELEIEINTLQNLNLDDKDEVLPGALVQTTDKCYFITFNTGGHKITVDNIEVNIVSMKAPITQKLIDEEVEINSIN